MKLTNLQPFLKSLNWHLVLATLYFVQTVAVYLWADAGFFRSLDITFLSQNVLTGDSQTTVRTLYDLDLKHILLIIPAGIGLFHLLIGLKSATYKKILAARVNVWRWLVSGLVSGLMLALTALILGITNISYLLLLLVTMVGFSWLGIITEYIQASLKPVKGRTAKITEKRNQLLRQVLNLVFTLKKISGLLPWLLVGVGLIAGSILGGEAFSWRHSFIYLSGVLLVIVWLWNASTAQLISGKQRDYCTVETIYLGSTFVLVSAWLWLIAPAGI